MAKQDPNVDHAAIARAEANRKAQEAAKRIADAAEAARRAEEAAQRKNK